MVLSVISFTWRHVVRQALYKTAVSPCWSVRGITSTPDQQNHQLTPWETLSKKQKVSKAMKAYLERAREHDEFMRKQKFEYDVGKRHLANMMGEDPESFTQKDVDRAIEYLFPSGIYDRAARPFVKPPEEVFPSRKAAEFDEAGRPHHFLFYTGKANFFKLMYDTVEKINDLYAHEDSIIRKKTSNKQTSEIVDLAGSVWVSKVELEKKVVEAIDDIEYSNFVSVMDRLAALPYSIRHKDFIESFRKPLSTQKFALEIPKPNYDESGRAFVTTYECLRKSARGEVTIRSPGTGNITINGRDLTYFDDVQSREQVLFPLIFTGMQNSVDVEGKVEGGGPSGQAGAIRWGIAWGLRSFVDSATVERMQVAGLLTRDNRRRERKKPGQPGARKKPTWKKR